MSKFAPIMLLAGSVFATAANAQQLTRPETLTGVQEFARFIAKIEVPTEQHDTYAAKLIAENGRAWTHAVMDGTRTGTDSKVYCARVQHSVKDEFGVAHYTASLCIDAAASPRDVKIEKTACSLTSEIYGVRRRPLRCDN